MVGKTLPGDESKECQTEEAEIWRTSAREYGRNVGVDCQEVDPHRTQKAWHTTGSQIAQFLHTGKINITDVTYW